MPSQFWAFRKKKIYWTRYYLNRSNPPQLQLQSLPENSFEMRAWTLARKIPRGFHRSHFGTSTAPEVTVSLGISRIYRVTYAAIFFATSTADSASTDEESSLEQ